MSRTRSSDAEAGFTLAALIVILTVISIIIAYTVPTQWSLVMRRERERQTIFLMKQYARGIENWERKHQGLPVSLEQLQEARQPRMLRGDGKWAMPLTGKDEDWIMVPPNAIEAAGGVPPVIGGGANGNIGSRVGVGAPAAQPGQPAAPSKLNPEASPKDYVGPFVAVRPNAKGAAMLEFNGAQDYNQWVYTLQDLKNERMMQQMALSTP
ncbi:MAG TPA: type II secretion system protein [Thermoanaerobaculia bacterium]|jgi:type II secretory pathway pseudopilin PulG